MSNRFLLEISTPERSFFKDEVDMVVLPALDGESGIMAGHEKMVAALVSGILRIHKDGEILQAAASDGYAMIYGDRVVVLLQSVEWPHELDVSRAHEALDRANARLEKDLTPRERTIAKAELRRAQARLHLLERLADQTNKPKE